MSKAQSELATNHAVWRFVSGLERHQVARLAGMSEEQRRVATSRQLQTRVASRFALDLCGFLNGLRRPELNAVAREHGVETTGGIAQVRTRLWRLGAELEARGASYLGTPVQPAPIVLGGKLVHCRWGPGQEPAAERRPRPVPPRRERAPGPEPRSLEELLGNADALVGVRLGSATRDKGAYGAEIARLLGIEDFGFSEPDWQGDVEIKSVPVVVDPSGWWRVKEDPAISMDAVDPLSKLTKVLWVARVSSAESPILSWFYQELSAPTRDLAVRFLHKRPKGPKGTTRRGWYLHKRFFVESGFLYSLNG